MKLSFINKLHNYNLDNCFLFVVFHSTTDPISLSRDETFKRSLAKLREDLLYANGLAREANLFAEERGKDVRFGVTLQIPPHNLTPGRRRRGGFVSEPAILVRRRGKGAQVGLLFYRLLDDTLNLPCFGLFCN